MGWVGSNGWNRARAWDEEAFLGLAVPELTTALGLRLIIGDLDYYEDPDPAVSFVDPGAVANLRYDWIYRVYACFPDEWHPVIKKEIASADNFYLALISHLDQVRFAIRTPRWIRATKYAAVALVAITIAAVVLAIVAPFEAIPVHTFVVIGELAPITAAVFGIISAVGRDRFRRRRARLVSEQVRQELRAAIEHGFTRPISRVASELAVLRELSLD